MINCMQNIYNCVRQDLLIYIEKVFIDYSLKNPDVLLWENIGKLLNESGEYGLKNFMSHMITTIQYLNDNYIIKTKIEKYKRFNESGKSSIYIRDFWASYKPLMSNTMINNINSIVDKDKTFTETDTKVENNALLKGISKVLETYKYEDLNITISEIMNNETYKYLYIFSEQLYGKTGNILHINLLINNLIETLKNSSIADLFNEIGWDPVKKEIKSLDYRKLKEVVTVKIPELYKSLNPEEKDVIETLQHINNNNFTIRLLNTTPKRYYVYYPPNVLPNLSYDELNEIDSSITKNIFDLFCFDDDGNIIRKVKNKYLDNILLDVSLGEEEETDETNCNKLMRKTEENFNKYFESFIESNKLEFYPDNFKKYQNFYTDEDNREIYEKNIRNIQPEMKLLEFIEANKYDKIEADLCYSKFTNLKTLLEEIKTTSLLIEGEVKQDYSKRLNSIFQELLDDINVYDANTRKFIEDYLIESENMLQMKKLEVSYNLRISKKMRENASVELIKYKEISDRMMNF